MASNAAGTQRPGLFQGRNAILIAIAGVSIAIAVGLIIASQVGSGDGTKTTVPTQAIGALDTAALLNGIPQSGSSLGNPKAPVTLVEYADVQCPYCAVYATDVLPAIVTDYVRTGKVRLEFRGMSFVGPDSVKALRAVIAAGQQNRLWNVLDLLYKNQGEENAGWVSDDLLRSIGSSVAGLDGAQMIAAADSDAVTKRMADDQGLADASGINSTPSFEIGKTGGTLERLQVSALEPSAFRPALDALLQR